MQEIKMEQFEQADISSEEYREYRYPDGVHRIDQPRSLWRKGDSHRVIDAEGRTHCPRKGWLAIVWHAPGKPVSF